MSDDALSAARTLLEDHDAFAADDDGYAVTTTPLDATIRMRPADDEHEEDYEAEFDVQVDLPTLDAVVANEPVANEVESGWHATLELRIDDAYDVAEVDPLEDPTFAVRDDVVHTRYSFAAPDAESGVNDAKVIVDYVEGTYVQGAIPGYDYLDPMAELLSRAMQRAKGDSSGAERGGTPL